ncbi:MAG: nitroreductase family protein [Actinomycetes bacterium]|jgi:nitroreductase|nr:MAG: nitroreductase [Actinomycetota bacterium]
MADFYQEILSLRAIRAYEDRPLSDEHLDAIVEAARWTGSSKNRQDWSFVVVTDRDRLHGLAECGDFTQPVRDSAATIVLVKEPGGHDFDLGRAAQNMMLAAKAIGVASCPITLHRPAEARQFLGLSAEQEARYAVAFGYPAPNAAPAKFGGRKPKDEVVRYDRA